MSFRMLYIVLFALLAVLPAKAAVTPEQEQQFTYYWYAAREAIDKGNYPEALVLLEFCNAIKPDDGNTLGFLGVTYHLMGQQERSMDALRRAFEADPRDQWYRYSEALLGLKTEEAQHKALEVLERAYKAQDAPRDEYLLERLKRGYASEGEWEQVLKMQDEIDLQKGYDAQSAWTHQQIYMVLNKPKKALAAIDKYLEIDPKNVQFLVFRAQALEHMKVKPAKLYAAYEEVLHLDPNHLMILNNYAYLLATNKGDLQKAEKMSQITIREQPNYPVYLDTYGWILHLQGQDDLAKFYLNKALDNVNGGMYFASEPAEEAKVKEEIQKHLNKIK